MSIHTEPDAPHESSATSAEVVTLEDGTRIITKPNGFVITVKPNGEATVLKDGKERPPCGTKKEKMIRSFQGEYRWLSNFTPVAVRLDGTRYRSVEHAYMSAKSDSPEWKRFCAETESAGQVKKASKDVPLVADWDAKKLLVMRGLLEQKFRQEPYRSQLLETGERVIQEGNRWNDKFWGVCLKTGEGENHLGKMIMKIRGQLAAEPPPRAPQKWHTWLLPWNWFKRRV